MSNGIYYNQEVTAADINDIAHDLGNISFNGFGTEKFGADALNGITASLVGAGVLTSGDMCRVIKANGYLYVQSGTIIFADGAKKTITTAVQVGEVGSCCIYARNDKLAGKCEIVTGAAFPESGDFVKLAEVSATGVISDKRPLATAKMQLTSGNNYATVDWSDVFNIYEKKIAEFQTAQWDTHTYILLMYSTKIVWGMNAANVEPGKIYEIGSAMNFEIKFIKNDGIVEIHGGLRSGGGSDRVPYSGTFILA